MLPDYFTLYLIGFSGAGKSTVGAKLSKRLDASFFDIDAEIEKKTNTTITEIFRVKGEPYFRALEVEMIQKVSNKRNKRKVISLGGGAFENRETRHCVKEHGVSIFLYASLNTIYSRMKSKTNRPLLSDTNAEKPLSAFELKEQIKTLLTKRIENYNTADIKIDIKTKTVSQIVNEIVERVS